MNRKGCSVRMIQLPSGNLIRRTQHVTWHQASANDECFCTCQSFPNIMWRCRWQNCRRSKARRPPERKSFIAKTIVGSVLIESQRITTSNPMVSYAGASSLVATNSSNPYCGRPWQCSSRTMARSFSLSLKYFTKILFITILRWMLWNHSSLSFDHTVLVPPTLSLVHTRLDSCCLSFFFGIQNGIRMQFNGLIFGDICLLLLPMPGSIQPRWYS